MRSKSGWFNRGVGLLIIFTALLFGSLAAWLFSPMLPLHPKTVHLPSPPAPTLDGSTLRVAVSTFVPSPDPPTPAPSLTPVEPSATAMENPPPAATQPSPCPIPMNTPLASNPPEPTSTPTPAPVAPCRTVMCQLLRQLRDLSTLPAPKNTTLFQASSQDRNHLEHYWDYFNSDELFRSRGFEIRHGYDGQKEYVILGRTAGPGYIARIYFTHRQHDWALEEGDNPKSLEATEWGFFHEVGNIRFYFDDEPTPRIDMPVTQFFSGNSWPFLAPLVGHYGTANGGNISYLPMPFSRSVLVATTGLPRLFGIEVVKFNQDPGNLHSFDLSLNPSEVQELNRAIDLWNNRGEHPYYPRGDLLSLKRDLTIPPFSSTEITLPGPGVITSLELYLASGMDEKMRMKIFWDDESSPSVEGLIRPLFGTAEGMRRYRSLPLGIRWTGDRNEFYNYFPMPFNSQARILFENGRGDATDMRVEILYHPAPFKANIPRFHAAFKRERLQARGDDGGNYILADLAGSGRYVGCILTMYDLDRSPVDAVDAPHWYFAYLESDMNIWVDGRYALPGTGIEGDFDAGYYYIYTDVPERNWIFPLSGNTWKDHENWGEATSQYRFYLTNKVEFTNSLRVEVEHGFKGNNLSVTYSSTAFWYQDEPG